MAQATHQRLRLCIQEVLHGIEVQRAVLEAGLVGNDASERRRVAWAAKPPSAWQAGPPSWSKLFF